MLAKDVAIESYSPPEARYNLLEHLLIGACIMRRSLKVPIVMTLGLFAALAAAAAFSSAEVSYRSAEHNGARTAEVLIGERPVIALLTSAGGYRPLERAEIVANRLRSALTKEIKAEDVTVTSVPSGAGLNIRDQLIVAIYPTEANAHGATPTALARSWRDNILSAVGIAPAEQPATPVAEQVKPAEETAKPTSAASDDIDWTGTAQKWVPIISVEQGGVSIGAAQIAGPTSQVNQVKAVAELRLEFRNIGRIYAYIPVRTLSVTKLDRVQGVSVWATGDVRLVNF